MQDGLESYEEAVHQLLLDLASIQADALKLAEGNTNAGQIIITGGFAMNQFFCRLMASCCPGKRCTPPLLLGSVGSWGSTGFEYRHEALHMNNADKKQLGL
jgi:hypothetical protein